MANHYSSFSVDELQNEIWKPVAGYEGFYEVSNIGRVRSALTKRLRSLEISNCGYYRLTLWKHRATSKKAVHSLVAEAFIGPRNNLVVNHKDMIKTNNRVSNLEYCTEKQNHIHATAHGAYPSGEKNNKSKLSNDSVREIRTLHAGGMSQHALARRFSVRVGTIHCIVHRQTWKHI